MPMTPHEKAATIKVLQNLLSNLETMPTTTKCIDCGHYQSGACLKWRETIPEDTLPLGCDEWVFNPFSPPF